MPNQTARKELIAVIQYILNTAQAGELDVITAAAERRKKELTQNMGFKTINPEAIAKQMSKSINNSISVSLDGVRSTFRNFAADILKKEAPELSPRQMSALVDAWIPSHGTYDKINRTDSNNTAEIAPELLYKMVVQFVSYGIGEMTENENGELTAVMGNWAEKYWRHFPAQLRAEIKQFINGEITSGEFQKKIH